MEDQTEGARSKPGQGEGIQKQDQGGRWMITKQDQDQSTGSQFLGQGHRDVAQERLNTLFSNEHQVMTD